MNKLANSQPCNKEVLWGETEKTKIQGTNFALLNGFWEKKIYGNAKETLFLQTQN